MESSFLNIIFDKIIVLNELILFIDKEPSGKLMLQPQNFLTICLYNIKLSGLMLKNLSG